MIIIIIIKLYLYHNYIIKIIFCYYVDRVGDCSWDIDMHRSVRSIHVWGWNLNFKV